MDRAPEALFVWRCEVVIAVDIAARHGTFRLEVAFRAEAPIVGLFGRSGAGKTCLVNVLAGISRPERGTIVVSGITLFDSARGIDVPPERRRLGYVFQDDLLFPHLDVESNLLYGFQRAPLDQRVIDPKHVIELLGLGSLLERLPTALSGGERQRVAIGRALLAQPRLLLMDEPLASLDVGRRDEVLRYIELLRDDLHIPIVYVSHSVAEITRLADTMVLLSEGKALAVGEVDEVMGRIDLRPQTGRYEAGAVIDTVVAAHDVDYGLTTLRFDGGDLTVPNVEALIGERVRVRIRARDVSIALARPEGLSIVNVLEGSVAAIADDRRPIVELQLRVGAARLQARITRRSCDELRLAEGRRVYALVKAVSLDRRSVGYA
jgi:molybdate transport system ATP-binding protein